MKKVLTSDGKTVLVGGKAMVGSVTNEPVQESDINFYDYDGTLLHAWSLAELQGKTELPELPTQPGLICQGWNWTLAELKAQNSEMDVGANYITDDGKTRIYVRFEDGRTSPVLGIGVNGTVTVDWGDGSTHDTLTGTDEYTAVYTPAHNYAAAGDYIISLTVKGKARLLGGYAETHASFLLGYSAEADARNIAYLSAIRRVHCGSNLALDTYALNHCHRLEAVAVSTEQKGMYGAFLYCRALNFLCIPRGQTFVANDTLSQCTGLKAVSLPSSLLTFLAGSVSGCGALRRIGVPDGVYNIDGYAFDSCKGLTSIRFKGGTSNKIKSMAFVNVTGIRYYDFIVCTTIPVLDAADAFTNIPTDCEIRVPAALAEEWKAATNWATYADHIVGV